MNANELELIESSEGVTFSLKPEGTIAVRGKSAAVNRALERIEGHRDEVAELLRARQAPEEKDVEREVAFDVPALSIQRQNYVRWFMTRTKYYWPNEQELDAMFAACAEGDLIIPDFAHSFTIRRPNGLLQAVDRKGRVGAPSPYSPAVKK